MNSPSTAAGSDAQVTGDHWDAWLGSDCPALLIAGSRQPCVDPDLVAEMISRRPNSTLVTLDTDHLVHKGDPIGFAETVREFLRQY